VRLSLYRPLSAGLRVCPRIVRSLGHLLLCGGSIRVRCPWRGDSTGLSRRWRHILRIEKNAVDSVGLSGHGELHKWGMRCGVLSRWLIHCRCRIRGDWLIKGNRRLRGKGLLKDAICSSIRRWVVCYWYRVWSWTIDDSRMGNLYWGSLKIAWLSCGVG